MPSYPCNVPMCSAYVPTRGECCTEHVGHGQRQTSHYDEHTRDPEARAFYNSAAWKRARASVLTAHPFCARCLREWARHVHHIIPFKRCTIDQRTNPDNLKPLCPECHNAEEREAAA